MSGTASMSRCDADQRPPRTKPTAASSTSGRLRMADSRIALVIGVRDACIDPIGLRQPAENLEWLMRRDCFSSGTQQSVDCIEVLGLQRRVGGNRERTEPIVLVADARGIAKLLHRIRRPARDDGK